MTTIPPTIQSLAAAFVDDWDASRTAMAADMRAAEHTDAYNAGHESGMFHARNCLGFNATAPADQPYQEWVRGYRAGWAKVTG